MVPHWVSPEGKKFRSKAAIKEFLAKTNPSLLPPLSHEHALPPNSSDFSPHLSHHHHHSHHSHSFPPIPSSLSSISLSGGELPSSVLTPLGEEDKIFGMNLHHQRGKKFESFHLILFYLFENYL